MGDLLVIKIDSVVDIITNSSSELFVASSDLTVEAIKEILSNLIVFHNTNFGSDCTFESAFGEIKTITNENLEKFVKDYIDWGVIPNWYNPPDRWKISNDLKKKFPEKEWFEIYKLADTKWEKSFNRWFNKNKEDLSSYYVGKVTILSAEDNSIPYELFGSIQGFFNADRWHLG